MVLLEVLIISGAVYYYKKHHKTNKARKLAFINNTPFVERDGSVTFPPGYPDLPSYAAATRADRDHKVQGHAPVVHREFYSDAPVSRNMAGRDEKAPLVAETREVVRDEKY